MIIAKEQLEGRIVLQGISWEMYESLRDADENCHVRMTYHRGALEIVSPSRKHEQVSYLLGRMIDQWTLQRKIEIAAGRNTTFRREDLACGLEPDNCYWIRHEKAMRGNEEVDLSVDPPPDLVVEVDVTSPSVSKMPIYLALGVPEIWHWEDERLQVLRVVRRGAYRARTTSKELPGFPISVAEDVLKGRFKQGDTSLIARFIRKIRSQRRK